MPGGAPGIVPEPAPGKEPINAWKSAHVLTRKILVDLDWRSRGGPSKWVTLLAPRVLKDWRGLAQ